MHVFIGADHAGFPAKEKIKKLLEQMGVPYTDVGAKIFKREDDYPDYAIAVAEAVARSGGRARGILICGSGVGVDIVANKVKGVRSVLGTTSYMVVQAVQHDHANVLSLAARINPQRQMNRFVRYFLHAKPSKAERHLRRVKKIINYEAKWLRLSRRS